MPLHKQLPAPEGSCDRARSALTTPFTGLASAPGPKQPQASAAAPREHSRAAGRRSAPGTSAPWRQRGSAPSGRRAAPPGHATSGPQSGPNHQRKPRPQGAQTASPRCGKAPRCPSARACVPRTPSPHVPRWPPCARGHRCAGRWPPRRRTRQDRANPTPEAKHPPGAWRCSAERRHPHQRLRAPGAVAANPASRAPG